MTYFQNLFTADFEGNWLLADRHHIPKFVCPRNAGRGDEVVIAWSDAPYNLTGNDSDSTNSKDTLEIVFALNNQKNWSTIAVDITATAATASAVTSEEIVSALNADSSFNNWFIAELGPSLETSGYNSKRVAIRQKKPAINFRFYINNGRAEEVLKFNARAGVKELPTYFARHSIDNRFVFDDSQNMLIELDVVGSNVHANIVDAAVNAKGESLDYTSATVRADWELLEGRSGLFDFTSNDGSGTVIVYHAGAKAGDLAKKIITSAGNTFVIPYTLQAGDLITPP